MDGLKTHLRIASFGSTYLIAAANASHATFADNGGLTVFAADSSTRVIIDTPNPWSAGTGVRNRIPFAAGLVSTVSTDSGVQAP